MSPKRSRVVLDAVRSTLISPELLSLIVILAVRVRVPSVFSWITATIAESTEGRPFLAGLGATIAIATTKLGFGTLLPGDKKHIFVTWNDYSLLKFRVAMALLVAWAGSALGAFLWLAQRTFDPVTTGMLWCAAVMPASMTLVTTAVAYFTVREMLALHSPSE